MKIWIPLFIYLAVQSITPGPNDLTCLYLGATKGLRGSLRFISGSMIMVFVKSVICGLLNIALTDIFPGIVQWLKWIGCAYMIYLAWTMIRSGWQSGEKTIKSEGTFLSGVLLQILNAKSWIAAISAYAVYVTPISNDVKTVVFVAFAFFVIATVASLIWAAFGSGIKSFIQKHKKAFGIIMGLSLLWCAYSAIV